MVGAGLTGLINPNSRRLAVVYRPGAGGRQAGGAAALLLTHRHRVVKAHRRRCGAHAALGANRHVFEYHRAGLGSRIQVNSLHAVEGLRPIVDVATHQGHIHLVAAGTSNRVGGIGTWGHVRGGHCHSRGVTAKGINEADDCPRALFDPERLRCLPLDSVVGWPCCRIGFWWRHRININGHTRLRGEVHLRDGTN